MISSPLIRVALSALAYFLAQALAFQFPESFGLVASIWPAAGVALATLLLNPRRLWPVLLGALFVTGLAANLLTDRPHFAIVGFMIANICETATSAWLITWWCSDTIRFDRVQQVVALAVAAFLVNGATSLLGAGAADLAQGSNFWTFYWTWYVADALGILLITPLIVVWARSRRWGGGIRSRAILETSGVIALGALTAWLAFGPSQATADIAVMPYLLWVALVWAALRAGTVGTATFLSLVALIAIGFTATGHSAFPLGETDTPQRLLAVQVFLGMMGLTGLLLAAAIVQTRESQALLHAVVEGTSDSVYAKDLPGRYLLINRAAARVLGESPADVIGHDDTSYFSPEEALAVMRGDQAAMASAEPLTYEERVTDKSGKQHTFLATKGPIRAEDGQVTGIFGISHDITARVETEQALREAEEKYRSVVERANDGITILQNGVVVFANQALADMSGCTREEIYGMGILAMVAPEDHELIADRVARRLAGEHPPDRYELVLHRKNGSPIAVEISAGLITYRNAPADLVIARDITERKRADELLRSSLREKQSLLKEVHHRVKNNLQVVASLMRLEGAQHADAAVKEMLGSLQGRVHSMALMHEMLYQVGTFAAVDLGDYLKRLTTHIAQMLVVRPGAIRIHVEVTAVQIEMDRATPCGLLVNELLSNSFKHGFPEGRTGEVRVELLLVDGGPQVRLRVSDTGVGLPEDFDQRRAQSLGMQLVSDLVGQLGGQLEITSDHGTSVSVTFLPRRPSPDGISAKPVLLA